MKMRELRQRIAALYDEAQGIVSTAESEDRDLEAQEQTEVDRLMGEAEGLEARLGRTEDLENRSNRLGAGGSGPAAGRQDPRIGLSEQDLGNYRIMRAIRAAASGDWTRAGFELEVSRAVSERLDREPQGFFVPAEWMEQRAPVWRDLSVGVPASGGYTVATDLLAMNFIELLRNRLVLESAGALVLSDLVGDVDIPKQTGAASVYWLGEGESPTEGAITFGQVGMKPKTVGGYLDITRRLLKQSSLDVEGFVRADLASGIALGVDLAGLHGSGAGNEPLGLASVPGIGSVVGGANGAAPDWADVVELETDVSTANADIGSLAYVTNAKVRGKLKQTETASGSGIFVWHTDPAGRPGVGSLNGYPALVSNQVSSTLDKGTSTGVCSAIFFGNWADLVIGLWGVLDILVDPFSLSTQGAIRVVAFQDVDIGVRNAGSFSAMLDALTA